MLQSRTVAAVVYIVTATVILGGIAFRASTDLQQSPLNHDIWQHVAAIEALMKNLSNPANPFVIGIGESRHFHPLWVGQAAFNLSFGFTVWDGLVITAYVSMAIFGVSVFLFAKAIFDDQWAPLRLLLMLLLAWGLQLSHTGYHSINALIDGAIYPATLLISLTFMLWVLAIKTLTRIRFALSLIPLVAFMFATHQLGAVIGLIGVAGIVLGHHTAVNINRIALSLAVLVGLGLSLLWPYHNPLQLMLSPGNSTWEGGPNFYGPLYLFGCLIPAVFGVMGLTSRRMRPFAIALVFYLCAYAIGLTGLKIAGRFLTPIVLVLQIGLAAYLPNISNPNIKRWHRKAIQYIGFASLIVVFFGLFSVLVNWIAAEEYSPEISAYSAAQILTDDIADTEQVAAFDVTAWPIVATGQKVLSVPWPEPSIADLAERQKAVKVLFDPTLSAETRRAEARALGIKTLVTDHRLFEQEMINILNEQAYNTRSSGTLVRFDLFE